jgi:hypothetical protein
MVIYMVKKNVDSETKSVSLASEIRDVMSRARAESANTAAQPKTAHVVSHQGLLVTTVNAWNDTKRTAFVLMKTFRALINASGLKLDDAQVVAKAGDSFLLEAYASYEVFVKRIVDKVSEWAGELDKEEGLTREATSETEMLKLVRALSEAVTEGDKAKIAELQERIAKLH